MTDDEFKEMLGIHFLDHISIYNPDHIKLMGIRYPGLEIKMDNNLQKLYSGPSLHSYISMGTSITLSFRGRTIKEDCKADDSNIIRMLKQFDDLV